MYGSNEVKSNSGIENATVLLIQSLMQEQHLTLDQALKILRIQDSEKMYYRNIIENQD
jgi:hypothetical protein